GVAHEAAARAAAALQDRPPGPYVQPGRDVHAGGAVVEAPRGQTLGRARLGQRRQDARGGPRVAAARAPDPPRPAHAPPWARGGSMALLGPRFVWSPTPWPVSPSWGGRCPRRRGRARGAGGGDGMGPARLHPSLSPSRFGGGGPELLGNPLPHLRLSPRALLRGLGGGPTRGAPAVAPVDVAGALRAWQARAPHGHPAGGKRTRGAVAVSRVVHSGSGWSGKTPHADGFSSLGCKAALASEQDVEITTGVGAFEKSTVFPAHVLQRWQ